MSVTRLVLRWSAIAPGEFIIPAAEAKHARVARVVMGEPLEVLDLDGSVGIGRLVCWEGAACRVAVDRVERERGEPAVPVVLAVGVLHTAAFDWLVEKATELGATAIVPLLTERVQGRKHDARIERWQRIAEAAVAQCGRSRPPRIGEPQRLSAFVTSATGLRLVAEPGAPPIAPGMEVGGAGMTVLVGPEGGLTAHETAAAHAAGFLGLHLGPRTLRAETAALAALAVVASTVPRITISPLQTVGSE
jgi:16S rRNA (uracil1498-N3)-methyltransferase